MHCAELFGSRAWVVAFLAFSASLLPQGMTTPMTAATTAAAVSIFSAPASILGNEVALRIGRRAWIVIVMSVTALVGIAMALLAASPWWVIFALLAVYSMLVMADSATLTAGLVASAEPSVRGAAMGLYSLIGFGLGGALGPIIFGIALDATGGGRTPSDWAIAFAALGFGCLLFPLFDGWLHKGSPFKGAR